MKHKQFLIIIWAGKVAIYRLYTFSCRILFSFQRNRTYLLYIVYYRKYKTLYVQLLSVAYYIKRCFIIYYLTNKHIIPGNLVSIAGYGYKVSCSYYTRNYMLHEHTSISKRKTSFYVLLGFEKTIITMRQCCLLFVFCILDANNSCLFSIRFSACKRSHPHVVCSRMNWFHLINLSSVLFCGVALHILFAF